MKEPKLSRNVYETKISEAYSEPFQTCKAELFAKKVNDWKTKSSILDVWQVSDYLSEYSSPSTCVDDWLFWAYVNRDPEIAGQSFSTQHYLGSFAKVTEKTAGDSF